MRNNSTMMIMIMITIALLILMLILVGISVMNIKDNNADNENDKNINLRDISSGGRNHHHLCDADNTNFVLLLQTFKFVRKYLPLKYF